VSLAANCPGRVISESRYRAFWFVTKVSLLVGLVTAALSASPLVAAAEEPAGDEELVRIAQQVPTFGGFYVDEDTQKLYVWLTDQGQSLPAAVQAILNTRGYSDLAHLTPVALAAQYSFTQLHAWHQQMGEVWTADGVVFTDIDDIYNRMTVGVEDPATHGPIVKAKLTELGIPVEAVEIVQQDPPSDSIGRISQPHPGESSTLPAWLTFGLISAVIVLAGLFVIRRTRPGQRNESAPSVSPAGQDAYV